MHHGTDGVHTLTPYDINGRKQRSCLYAILLVLGLIALLSCAAIIDTDVDAFHADGIHYEKTHGKTVGVTGCDDTEILTIPSTVKHSGKMYDVTSIKSLAFRNNKHLISVTIPDSVTSINEGAFKNCRSLTSITFGDGLKSIGGYAFYGCKSLKSITIPDKMKFIGVSTFSHCTSLESIDIPDSVTSIYYHAFENCTSLTSVTIPNSVKSIKSSAFDNCTSLKTVTLGINVESLGKSVFEGCNSLTALTIPNSTTSIGECTFKNCTSLTSVTIGKGIKSIDRNLLDGCRSLTEIKVSEGNDRYSSINGVLFNKDATKLIICPPCRTVCDIPDGVTSIKMNLFNDCRSLTEINVSEGNSSYSSVDGMLLNKDGTKLIMCPKGKTACTIPDSVRTICSSTFKGCTYLTSVTIGDGVKSINKDLFKECKSMTSVTIGEGVKSIDKNLLKECKSLTSVTIGEGVKSIDRGFFNNHRTLTEFNVSGGNNNYSSADGMLLNKNGTELIMCPKGKTECAIPDSVQTIGKSAFEYCNSLTSVNIPGTVRTICDGAFYECKILTSVTIGKGCSLIQDHAFCRCMSLRSVTIPEGVKITGDYVFNGCMFYDFDGKKWLDVSDLPGYSYYGMSSFKLIRHYTDNTVFKANGDPTYTEGMDNDEGTGFIVPDCTEMKEHRIFAEWSCDNMVLTATRADSPFTADGIHYKSIH